MDDTLTIKKGVAVVTADGERLGEAVRLFERRGEINPDLKLYASYLLVRNWSLGDQFYVPVDFVSEVDAVSGEVNLVLTERQVGDRTFSRMPQFVVAGEANVVELI